MRIFGTVFVIVLVCVPKLQAQMFEQIYPEDEVVQISTAVHWNGDTMYLPGNNQVLLQSTDAGKTWDNIMKSKHDWNFYRAEKTSTSIFLLAEPTVFYPGALPDGHVAALLKYDPWTQALDVVNIPALEGSDSSFISIIRTYDITANNDAVFILQQSNLQGLSINRTIDDGNSWVEIPIPDSLKIGQKGYIFCYDPDHLAIISNVTTGNNGLLLHITEDGGQTWKCDPNLGVNHSFAPDRYVKAGFAWITENEMVVFSTAGTMLYSSDAGTSWEQRKEYPPVKIISQLIGYPDGTGYMLADGHLYRTNDKFESYVDIIPDAWVTHVGIAGQDTLFATHGSENLYVSHDGGISWDYVRWRQYHIHNMSMLTAEFGVLNAHDYAIGSNEYYCTKDGWRSKEFVESRNFAFAPIYLVTETLWYAIRTSTETNHTLVYRTMDGGVSWNSVLTGDDLGGITGRIGKETIEDTSYFGIISDEGLVYTSDRGESWSITQYLGIGGTKGISYRTFLRPGDTSWLLVKRLDRDKRDCLLKSDGDWTKWDTVLVELDTMLESSYFRNLYVLPTGEVYVLANYKGPSDRYSHQYIHRSSDEGQSWEYYRSKAYDFDFFDDGTGVSNSGGAGHYVGVTGGTMFCRSNDGWKTAIDEDALYHPATYLLTVGSNTIYLYAHNGIFRNSTGGVNDVRKAPEHPQTLTIHSPYPHPVHHGETVMIPVDVANGVDQTLRLTLHDMLGREVKVIHSTTTGTGRNVIPWNVSGLSTGMYILRAQHGNSVTVKPIIVQ